MKGRTFPALAVVVLSLLIAGCAETPTNGQMAGTAGGAAAGAALGWGMAQQGAAVTGGVVGAVGAALIGAAIAETVDAPDRHKAASGPACRPLDTEGARLSPADHALMDGRMLCRNAEGVWELKPAG
jgi:hypothetical protein